MKRFLCLALCAAFLTGLTGCGNASKKTDDAEAPPSSTGAATGAAGATGATGAGTPEAFVPPPSDSTAGYRELYSSEYTTLNYLSTSNAYELKAAAKSVDGLTEYDAYGVVKPALAENWFTNADNTIWTFKIRQGVKWVDYQGGEAGEVTAQDWVDAAEYVNNAHNNSGLQYMFNGIVKNAEKYFDQTAQILEAENAVAEGEAASVEEYYQAHEINAADFISFEAVGVKALDPYTLEYTMESPCPFFISVLAYASYLPAYGPFLAAQGDNFGIDNETILYNGAYILSEFEPNVKHVFTANLAYWELDKVYIPKLTYIYNADDLTIGPSMFQKGELEQAYLGADILDNWLDDPAAKDLVRPSKLNISYSYFYAFNFEPRFDAQYEPDNWKIAVNNENFRQALLHGLDRMKALAVQDPYNTATLLNNTITPATFTAGAGKDFTQYDSIKPLSEGDSFNETLALQYRDKAREELTAAGAVFPVKILMPYNPSISNWDKECQIVEQQLTNLLGADFIQIIVEAGPSTGFLGAVRRSGAYAMMKCNWGADYADPQTWTEPFASGNSYNFMYTDPNKMLGEIPVNNKTQETQDLMAEYYRLLDAAKAHTSDIAARYAAFAEAEAFLIQHAIVIPFSVDTYGYVASYVDPFSEMHAPYGLSPYNFKGVQLLSKPMNIDEFNAANAKWQSEWAIAQAAAQASANP
ncbi:MAG: ABC transporter substrate-binding protein [Clostridiales bacterium]|nr:ABC transporter substrate-binding protein [Clostridiales bacterium]